MRIATMTAGLRGYRQLAGNTWRLAVARDAVSWARRAGVDGLFFPAGFLRARDESHGRALVDSLRPPARCDGPTVAVGVDFCTPRDGLFKQDLALLVAQRRLPFAVFGWHPGRPELFHWQQRSTSSRDWAAAGKGGDEARSVAVAGAPLEILLCGEGFSPAIRRSVTGRASELHAVVILAHRSQGFRAYRALDPLAAAGLPAFVSAHTLRGNGKKHARYPMEPCDRGTYDGDVCFGDGDAWIEVKVFDVP